LRLGTRLTIYLSLIIIIAMSGYGYYHIMSRRDILIRKMKAEVRSIGRTLKVSLEKVSLTREMEYVQDLIDAVEEDEKTLGVVVYHQGKGLVFRSRSLGDGLDPYLEAIKKSIQEGLPQEEFGVYKKVSIFSYAFPLRDKRGKNIGGVSILQHTSFMDEDIKKAKWNIFVMILLVIGGAVTLILLGMRKWISQPISQLINGIRNMARGNLNIRIDLKRGDELSELSKEFNQMAFDLKEAQDRIIREGETKLELERSLRQSEKLAAIGQLASGLAHEIGTPLNIISGRTELAQRRLDDKELVQKNLVTIAQQTERITKIIQQLLGFVRKKRPEQKALGINLLLGTTLNLLDQQIRKQGIRVVKDLKEDLPSMIGDPDQLQQVFLNLILNAVQSMPDGGELRVCATYEQISKEGLEDGQREYVMVCVGDTGIGMEKEVLQNIFNPFFTTKGTGTGLGLMVSQGIIQDHEGWIDVQTEIGKGSVFKVYIPCFSGEVKEDG
jgi:two-component system, NtrC family, sensor kinase